MPARKSAVDGRFAAGMSKQRAIKKPLSGDRKRGIIQGEKQLLDAVALGELKSKVQRLDMLLRRKEKMGVEPDAASAVRKDAAGCSKLGQHERAYELLKTELDRRETDASL